MTPSTVTSRLRSGLHAYRHLGPRHGTATALRHLTRAGRGRVRAARLHWRPVTVQPGELEEALGGRPSLDALLVAGKALPTVSMWADELSALTEPDRTHLLDRADEVLSHRFDLLGSGPTYLGEQIDWQRDFKSGRSWPLSHISRLPISYSDSSDIKVPWELSRFQHLPLIAAAWRLTGEPKYLDEMGAQLTSWIAANPVEFGANWACTMDVGLRAVNWLAALALCPDDAVEQPWFEAVLSSLLIHARFIRSHLEYGAARGNHYLSDVVGLLVASAPFSASADGIRWARWATSELAREMHHQVRADGCDHEASTSYHRLVTELFIVGADAADALLPGGLDPGVRSGVERMLGFAADYTAPNGLAPQIGDADDGRVLPLADYGRADQRSHLHLFRQARTTYEPKRGSAAYATGGFYILRTESLYCAVRCGDVGIYGRGCHAHNDLLAFELHYRSTPLVVDPGSYLYTADPANRNHFRSTAAHSALQIDAAEQNELREDRLFAMVDRARAEVLGWEASTDVTTLTGRHSGFESLPSPATHTRTLRLREEGFRLEITDEVVSDGPHELTWSFPLAPCTVEAGEGHVVARFPTATLYISGEGCSAAGEAGWLSPAYGVRLQTPVVRLRRRSEPGKSRSVILLRVEPAEAAP